MLEVIGAGFGRTGTMSLQAALDRLGFGPCYHMLEVFQHPDHIAHWVAAADGQAEAWMRPLAGYRATTDWPGATFWRDLAGAYPDAKVILTTRDPGLWYESISKTIFVAAAAPPEAGAIVEHLEDREAAQRMHDFAHHVVFDPAFGGRLEDRDHAIACYERHNEDVRRSVPPERLLDYQVTQGWEPLCAFLGVPVPDDPYPRLNDRAWFTKVILGRG